MVYALEKTISNWEEATLMERTMLAQLIQIVGMIKPEFRLNI